MKILKYFFFVALIAVIFTACNKNDSLNQELGQSPDLNGIAEQNSDLMTRAMRSNNVYSGWEKIIEDSKPPYVAAGLVFKRFAKMEYVSIIPLALYNVKSLYKKVDSKHAKRLSIYEMSNLSENDAFITINSLFFRGDCPTRKCGITFAFKEDYTWAMEGDVEFTAEVYKRALIINGNHAKAMDIGRGLTIKNVKDQTENDRCVYIGFDPEKQKQPNSALKRTLIGVRKGGSGDELVILVAEKISGKAGNKLLRDTFGCFDVVMFDGSDSSQILHKGKSLPGSALDGTRTIPVAMEFYLKP